MSDFANSTITLANPVADHFEAFIAGNATRCDRVVQQGSALGQRLVICGAGPSLRENVSALKGADQVWGCNSAAPWLVSRKLPCTHAFTIDQTPEMVNEWRTVPDVEYLLASTVHPHVIDLLEKHKRTITFFHNYVGIKKPPVAWEGERMEYEDWLYAALYPATIRAGSGLNATTRAIDVALYMGFSKIVVVGADCAMRVRKQPPKGAVAGSPEHMNWLRRHVLMHANGDHALASGATPITMQGEIDGRTWHTKPDMMISAVFLVKMARKLKGVLELVGDTLPNALMDKDDAFLDRLPTLVDSRGNPLKLV